MEFFRQCPNCGRRFHVKLENEHVVHTDRKAIPKKQATGSGGNASAGTWTGSLPTGNIHLATGYMAPTPIPVLYEGQPFVLESKEFQNTYKCGHCGHEWTEHHREEHREH